MITYEEWIDKAVDKPWVYQVCFGLDEIGQRTAYLKRRRTSALLYGVLYNDTPFIMGCGEKLRSDIPFEPYATVHFYFDKKEAEEAVERHNRYERAIDDY